MKRAILLLIFVSVVSILRPPVSHAQRGHDYPPFAGIDGLYIYTYEDKRFDFHDFQVDDTGKTTRVEGHKISIQYLAKNSSANTVSDLEIRRTLEGQVQSINAQILFESKDDGCTKLVARFERAGRPVWFEGDSNGCGGTGAVAAYYIVEEQEFQPLTHLSQTELRNAIDTTGKAVLHVNFAFDRATLPPDATPIIQAIVGVMKSEPSLRLEVDGHTDGVGPDDYNQRLSEARATAVVASLASAGIGADRLKSAGFGASRPIAGNDTEQGRAENRRVELIRQ